jgi:hypothetical protein
MAKKPIIRKLPIGVISIGIYEKVPQGKKGIALIRTLAENT